MRFAEWLRSRRRDRAEAALREIRAKRAASLVQAAFVEAYPEPNLFSRWHKVDAVAGGHIVTLMYGATRPPQRCWWHVDEAGGVAELPEDVAALQINIPVWR